MLKQNENQSHHGFSGFVLKPYPGNSIKSREMKEMIAKELDCGKRYIPHVHLIMGAHYDFLCYSVSAEKNLQ